MIQPLGSSQVVWAASWSESERPALLDGEIVLPVAIAVVEGAMHRLLQGECRPEIDQRQLENLFSRLIQQHGSPDEIVLPKSRLWDARAWKTFSRDFGTRIRVIKPDTGEAPRVLGVARLAAEELNARSLQRAADGISAHPPKDVARALAHNARRMHSHEKRRRMLEVALEIDGQCAAANLDMADMEMQRGAWKPARTHYEVAELAEVERWRGRNPEWWFDRETRLYLRAIHGRLLVEWNLGNYETASEQALRLLETNPADHQGVRFILPLLYLLGEQGDLALSFYGDYERNYCGDMQEPGFLFGWGLALYQDGREREAQRRYRQAMVRNVYIAPLLLDAALPDPDVWHPGERAEPEYADEFFDSFAVLWDRDPASLRMLREVYHNVLPSLDPLMALRAKIADRQDQRYDPDYEATWKRLVEEERRLSESIIQEL